MQNQKEISHTTIQNGFKTSYWTNNEQVYIVVVSNLKPKDLKTKKKNNYRQTTITGYIFFKEKTTILDYHIDPKIKWTIPKLEYNCKLEVNTTAISIQETKH